MQPVSGDGGLVDNIAALALSNPSSIPGPVALICDISSLLFAPYLSLSMQSVSGGGGLVDNIAALGLSNPGSIPGKLANDY